MAKKKYTSNIGGSNELSLLQKKTLQSKAQRISRVYSDMFTDLSINIFIPSVRAVEKINT